MEEEDVLVSDNCVGALHLSPAIDWGVSILGDTTNIAVNGERFVSTCPGAMVQEHGLGTWYRFSGEGSSITASTCLSSDEDSETSISVFEGSCDNLRCVAMNEIACGSQHHSVTWDAEGGADYFLFVQASNSVGFVGGRYILYTEETTSNALCRNSVGPLQTNGSPTFGSTRSALFDPILLQGENSATAGRRGVWYSVLGTGTTLTASTCSSDDTNFQTFLTLYEGSDCDSLIAIEPIPIGDSGCLPWETGSTTSWDSIAGQFYYLFLEGDINDAGDSAFGNFALSISVS